MSGHGFKAGDRVSIKHNGKTRTARIAYIPKDDPQLRQLPVFHDEDKYKIPVWYGRAIIKKLDG